MSPDPQGIQSSGQLSPRMHVQSLVSVLTREDYGGASMEELLGSRYASPFIQAALKAASMLQGNRMHPEGMAALEGVLACPAARCLIHAAEKQRWDAGLSSNPMPPSYF
eukprot:1160782-Pelagomonas_calceolata.AAC.3